MSWEEQALERFAQVERREIWLKTESLGRPSTVRTGGELGGKNWQVNNDRQSTVSDIAARLGPS
jgi:hypothetical protein